MDPYNNQRYNNNQPNSDRYTDIKSPPPGGDEVPQNPNRDPPDGGNLQANSRQPQYLGGFTMFPPNESQRSKLKTMAQKEEEERLRWKEENRVQTVQTNPEKLGGSATLAGAREKQFAEFRCSKLQKKLKQEELDKKRRQEEEEENQRMKAEQRKKAERQEEKKRQDERRRRQEFEQDHLRKTESFLQRFERTTLSPPACGSATHASSRTEAGKSLKAPKSESDVKLEHRRVNSAFLHNLEAQTRGSEKEKEPCVQECPFLDWSQQPYNPFGPPFSHLDSEPEQNYYSEAGSDNDWALMKLIEGFPNCNKDVLEDILEQCNGDYQQAYTLLTLE